MDARLVKHAKRHRRIPTLVRRNRGSHLPLWFFPYSFVEDLGFLDSKLSKLSDPGGNGRTVLLHYIPGLYLSYLDG